MSYNDSTYICPDTVKLYANTNEAFLAGKGKGIILELPGLGGGSCMGGSMDLQEYCAPHAKNFAENGIVLAYLFPGPWSWGNRGAVRMADAVVAALAEKYTLGKEFPLLVSGGSMGGQGSLLYAAETRFRLRGVAAACPCVDIPALFHVRPEFPRTFLSAIAGYDMPFDEALRQISPVHRVNDMQDTAYYICSNSADELIPETQIDTFAEALQNRGISVTYRRQPDTFHGQFLPDVWDEMHRFMLERILA